MWACEVYPSAQHPETIDYPIDSPIHYPTDYAGAQVESSFAFFGQPPACRS